MTKPFCFPAWLNDSFDLGGIKDLFGYHAKYRAVLFAKAEDRDAYLQLSEETYPCELFIVGTIEGVPAIQHSPR